MCIRSHVVALAVSFLVPACAQPVVRDPREAAERYAQAVKRHDAGALYALLTEESQRAYGPEGVERLMEDSQRELERQAGTVSSPRAKVEAEAEVPFQDGETARLVIENGRFRVAAAGALPAGARTPAQALDELRQVLARRSYAGLVRVLTSETRGSLERDLRSLVLGLEAPETLEIEQSGDRAEVEVPGGHKVWLKRETGVWRIQNFE